ncbi:helix-turn-helix domain-containing protein [Corynebacterium choanae]|uniref:HTH-type transcriptional repressor of iron proteins A n=1 Tax=Corynebacterium choanae TaxID=1862358 RepID=A0A3G6J5W3_9CORY|nr:helix-turn-helix domain-containing protein [Corynebacterium choanae]AZA13153.1 HTH-type transcriptional repressor of iron proteins A [Corynebacterium choanae]
MVEYQRSLLLYCFAGQACVTVGDQRYQLSSGQLCVTSGPAVQTGDGLILPIWYDTLPEIPTTRVMTLPAAWRYVMVAEFAASLQAPIGAASLSAPIERLLVDPAVAPPMPTAAAAQSVAAQLLDNPACQLSLSDFADQHGLSPRTLQRQFLQSTNLSFSQWRTAARVASAAALLSHGFSVAVTADMVGFQATSSLTRAFHRQTGCAPSLYCAGSSVTFEHIPQIPATAVCAQQAKMDETWWIYRGSATLTSGDYCRFLTRGDLVTLPAESDAHLEVAAGSIALPLGGVAAVDETPDLAAVVARFTPALAVAALQGATGGSVLSIAQRLNSARQMLRAGQAPAQVGQALDFPSVHAFARAFRLVHGTTPRGYQQHHQFVAATSQSVAAG